MKNEIENPYPGGNCFFCGENNARGLKLKFYWDEETEEVFTHYLPESHFAGQGDILHGAIQMGLLDEIMGWASWVFTGESAVTSDLHMDFLRPAYINGKELRAVCRAVSRSGPRIKLESSLWDSDGHICSKAAGTYHILPREKYNDLIHSR